MREHVLALLVLASVHTMIDPFDDGGWALSGGATVDGSHGSHSEPNALTLPFVSDGTKPGTSNGEATRSFSLPPAGQPCSILLWVKADDASQDAALALTVKNPLGEVVYSQTLPKGRWPNGWRKWAPASFTSPGGLGTVVLNSSLTVPLNAFSAFWLVDDFTITVNEEVMARMLATFGVRAVMSHALAALNAEIAYVADEANTGLDLPEFTTWRSYDAGVATPDVVEFEAFEIGPLTFPNRKYDQSTWHPGARAARSISSLPVRVAINHAGRGNAEAANAMLSASQMHERNRMYGAALFRCFDNDPTCGLGNAIQVMAGPVRYTSRELSRITGNALRALRVEHDFDLLIQESSVGETTHGGATLPSVVMEMP